MTLGYVNCRLQDCLLNRIVGQISLLHMSALTSCEREHWTNQSAWLAWQVLQPAIELAEGGFPVSPLTAHNWDLDLFQIKNYETEASKAFYTAEGKAPKAGQLHRNPDLAATFRCLAESGASKGMSDLISWLAFFGHIRRYTFDFLNLFRLQEMKCLELGIWDESALM